MSAAISRSSLLALALLAAGTAPAAAVDLQPLRAQAHRVADALTLLGARLPAADRARLDGSGGSDAEQIAEIQAVLDPLCLANVEINAESRVKASRGAAPASLMQQGWRVFLVKVSNQAGVTAPLRVQSPNAEPLVKPSTGQPTVEQTATPADVANRWCDVRSFDTQPLERPLSGLEIEYRILEIFSRDSGRREAKLLFDVGQGTQDLGFRNELNVLFNCSQAVQVKLHIHDADGRPATAALTIRDGRDRLYPSPARRLAPDLFFQDQVYRADGETLALPPGEYRVSYGRGPEYRLLERTIQVPQRASHEESFSLERWINLAQHGWYSGDHHIHAAGCAHYDSPTEGIRPEDMLRQILGEDLAVGCVLSWGPCWYFQKQFFQAKTSELSTPAHLMRYDVEVSGFPSSHAGHVCLLGLKEDDYPGTTRIDQWPSWDLPILRWAHEQGAVTGFAHSGRGLEIGGTQFPSEEMPQFNGIGANEFIVDAAHGLCDFISTVDTPAVWELNIWYHALNCGLTTRISGETDFPCIYGERVGLGRSYVKLDPAAPLTFESWLEGVRVGRCYVSDGESHLFDFRVDGLGVGEPGEAGRASVLRVPAGQELAISVQAAALLPQEPRDGIRRRRLDEKPYWHVERARVGETRNVNVELIAGGKVVGQQPLLADGTIQPITFRYAPDRSTWLAVRIFPSAHTNPIFVERDGKPVRPSRASAEWCLDAVDACWKSKAPRIRPDERPAAAEAYEQARQFYRKVIAESAGQ